MADIAYERPYLYPKQEKAIFSGKRWSLCEASTKSGKTQGAIVRLIEWGLFGNGRTPLAPGQNYWWVAPVSAQANIAFERIKTNLTAGTFVAKASPTPTIKLITNTNLVFKSADNPDSLYGEDVYAAIADEASRWPAPAWHALRSTLTATRGPAVLIGNVKGKKNWFYEFCRRVENGMEPNGAFERISWRDAVTAGVLDTEEIDDARRNLPENVFKELYEAIASDDTGNPFGENHIIACVRPLSNLPPVAFGVDLAKSQDYVVVIGFDNLGQVCVFERWNNVPWRDTIKRIWEIVGEDTPTLVDSTGVGDPVLEELQVEHGNFKGYQFTGPSKQRLMEGLAVSIQGREITFPDGPIKNELLLFEYQIGRTGVRYAAPEGYHDDCVCALALARQMWVETAPGANLIEYLASEARRQRYQTETQPGVLGAEPPPATGDTDVASLTELLDNELTKLYQEHLAEYTDGPLKCFRCHEAVGADRVSDGVLVWHRDCIAGGNQQIQRQIAA